jgi:gamma-glutamylcyclotransferase (GGCT)/AIG2-like uncharacterized protein YtfP
MRCTACWRRRASASTRDGCDASVLARLDSYEGCGPDDAPPHEFRRERTQVRLHGGATVSAWVYGYARAVDEARRVDSGDWAVRGC